ncbi:MAG: RES family NAD+ phosphorylase [Burkholderiales bacterium]
MLVVWRITTARFARSAFSGEGARLYGGRWSPKGVPVVYTAANQSLAMLEMLVQDQPLRARYVMIETRIPSGVKIDRVSIDDLPSLWREIGAREKLQAIGSEWVRNRNAAVLAVPSAIVPHESNYLLNPLHPAFKRINIGEPNVVETDLRLIRLRLRSP